MLTSVAGTLNTLASKLPTAGSLLTTSGNLLTTPLLDPPHRVALKFEFDAAVHEAIENGIGPNRQRPEQPS